MFVILIALMVFVDFSETNQYQSSSINILYTEEAAWSNFHFGQLSEISKSIVFVPRWLKYEDPPCLNHAKFETKCNHRWVHDIFLPGQRDSHNMSLNCLTYFISIVCISIEYNMLESPNVLILRKIRDYVYGKWQYKVFDITRSYFRIWIEREEKHQAKLQ